MSASSSIPRLLHRFALFIIAWAVLLIWWGAAVTTENVGLAVPDWPLAFNRVNPDGWWGLLPLLLEHGEDFVLYALLDFVTENYQPVSEAIHAEIDELEHNVLCSSLSERDIQKIHGLRRDVLRLKRYVAPMVEISQELQKLSFPFIDKNMRPYFRDVQIHVTRQMEDLSSIRDIASQTIEIGMLLESSRQSITQRKFAAWAAILAFPTAVAGIYGMNFQNMPELTWHYGYFGVLGFITVGCIGLWASFKRSGWL